MADVQRYFDQKIVGRGTVITNKTPLRPFHKDTTGTVWTPDDTRDWFKLGYTYPELPTGNETPAQLLKMVNDNYGISRQEALILVDKVPGVEKLDDGAKTWDYALSIKYSKYGILSISFCSRLFSIAYTDDHLGLHWVVIPSTLRSS